MVTAPLKSVYVAKSYVHNLDVFVCLQWTCSRARSAERCIPCHILACDRFAFTALLVENCVPLPISVICTIGPLGPWEVQLVHLLICTSICLRDHFTTLWRSCIEKFFLINIANLCCITLQCVKVINQPQSLGYCFIHV